VIGGPAIFLRVVDDFRSFADAITNKLVSEIAALTPGERAASLPDQVRLPVQLAAMRLDHFGHPGKAEVPAPPFGGGIVARA
jgi:Protein of unknown function (DUF1194)